jgi:hypothetical protein
MGGGWGCSGRVVRLALVCIMNFSHAPIESERVMSQTRATPRPGRPRPAETIERDEHIYALLTQGARSRGQLAHEAGLTTDLVALALKRLHRCGRIRQCLQDGVIVWSVADDTPCP